MCIHFEGCSEVLMYFFSFLSFTSCIPVLWPLIDIHCTYIFIYIYIYDDDVYLFTYLYICCFFSIFIHMYLYVSLFLFHI